LQKAHLRDVGRDIARIDNIAMEENRCPNGDIFMVLARKNNAPSQRPAIQRIMDKN